MTTRKGAFDPARLDELDDLLAPPAAIPIPIPIPRAVPAPAPAPQTLAEERTTEAPNPRPEIARPPAPRPRPARAAMTAEPVGERGIVTVTARVPRELYEQLSETLARLNERPSYAQIIAWTCRDHAEEMLDAISDAAYESDHTLRGRRPAANTVLMAPRFRPVELAALDRIIKSGAERLAAAPTRTAAIDAAIRIAIRTGVPGVPTGARWSQH